MENLELNDDSLQIELRAIEKAVTDLLKFYNKETMKEKIMKVLEGEFCLTFSAWKEMNNEVLPVTGIICFFHSACLLFNLYF